MPSEGIIMVLGVTGAGKSYMVNKLKEDCVKEGPTLRSETTKCQAVEIILDDDEEENPRHVTVVDTPGFNDTERPDGEVLAEIAEFVGTQHALGIPLKGVLYLHNITDNRVTGSSRTYLSLLESLVGTAAMENVILVTTMWNKLRDEDEREGLRRQQELIDDFWRPLIDQNAEVARFNGTTAGAFSLVSRLASKETVVLRIQREIIDENVAINQTTIGMSLLQKLESSKVEYTMRLVQLDLVLTKLKSESPLSKAKIKEKERERGEVEEMLRRIDKSVALMKERPGVRIRQRVKQAMSKENAGRAVHVLAALLNIGLFVARVVVGV